MDVCRGLTTIFFIFFTISLATHFILLPLLVVNAFDNRHLAEKLEIKLSTALRGNRRHLNLPTKEDAIFTAQ